GRVRRAPLSAQPGWAAAARRLPVWPGARTLGADGSLQRGRGVVDLRDEETLARACVLVAAALGGVRGELLAGVSLEAERSAQQQVTWTLRCVLAPRRVRCWSLELPDERTRLEALAAFVDAEEPIIGEPQHRYSRPQKASSPAEALRALRSELDREAAALGERRRLGWVLPLP
ncbi:MAG: hypothetical protein ACI8S6_004382, partial [Myxococcota bacterium]